jgi:hypothetical protein
MTVPFHHGAKAPIKPLPVSRSMIGKRKWLDDRSPMATFVLGALLMLVWMGALIGFALAFARRIF